MGELSAYIHKGDWRSEKHVPVIKAPDSVKAGEVFDVKVTLGKEIAHPNTTEHHISWISLYYHAEDEKFPHQVGHYAFSAHGESTEGPNQGPVYANHEATVSLKISKPGTLHALAFCNIHGLWESSSPIAVG